MQSLPLSMRSNSGLLNARTFARCRRTAPPPRFHRSAVRSAPAGTAASSSKQDLLSWATELEAQDVPVSITELPSKAGRGLVAVRDIAPGSVILSVRFGKVYASLAEHELEFHWSVDMALRLLKDKKACKEGQSSDWCPWIAQLPQHVLTPLEFTEHEVAAIADDSLIREVQVMQECMEASYEALEEELQDLGCSYRAFLNAVQVLHSRCFFQPETGCHMAVPGIDMANHSARPNAQVAVQHSPAAVQGLAAIEEVCDPGTLQGGSQEESRFQLVAGHEGIRQGEEVTISYGSMWPDAAFLLLFGFLPEGDNPQNSCTLFSDIEDMAHSYAQLLHEQLQHSGVPAPSVDALTEQLCTCAAHWEGAEECVGLFIMRDGMDGRLPAAFQVLESCSAGSASGAEPSATSSPSQSPPAPAAASAGRVSLPALLQHRAAQRAQELREVDHRESQLGLSGQTSARSLAAAFRQRQQAVLQAFLGKR